MRRSEAREILMQMLYSMEAQGDFSEEAERRFEDDFLGESEQADYYRAAYGAVAGELESIDALIEQYARGWHVSRMAKTDLAVLRLCVAELCFMKGEKIPVGAAINEAVRLAKKYGDEDSGKLVNGILGQIARHMPGDSEPEKDQDQESEKEPEA
jgi:N utilization substance protein B